MVFNSTYKGCVHNFPLEKESLLFPASVIFLIQNWVNRGILTTDQDERYKVRPKYDFLSLWHIKNEGCEYGFKGSKSGDRATERTHSSSHSAHSAKASNPQNQRSRHTYTEGFTVPTRLRSGESRTSSGIRERFFQNCYFFLSPKDIERKIGRK